MTAPTVTATLDKSSYLPGEVMVLTVTYADSDVQPTNDTVTATDAAGHSSAPVVTSVAYPLTITVTDDSGRAWSLLSDSGHVAVYRAVA